MDKQPIQKWEYSKWTYNPLVGVLEDILNSMGQAGWELIAVHSIEAMIAIYIFKRPIIEQ